jgi:PAT family beta-lactamase induction signal transducer AmpG
MLSPSMMSNPGFRFLAVLVLGFASGLPLALSAAALQTWLTVDGIDIATIGFFALVGLPYTFKFLWAPLMDRFEPPIARRRQGWIIITQLAIAATLYGLSLTTPSEHIELVAFLALSLAFFSASQDVVIDAYRTDILLEEQRGLGSSLSVFGYRLAMIVSGGIALVWADAVSGNGWSWPFIYRVMAMIMLSVALYSALLLPPVPSTSTSPKSNAFNDLRGCLALAITIAIGYVVTTKLFSTPTTNIMNQLFADTASTESLQNVKKWADLVTLLLGLLVTIPACIWVTRKVNFETLNRSLANFFSLPQAKAVLGFIILYKLGDAFAGSLATPFLIKGVGFTQAEIGVINKVIGIWLTILGAILGGMIMMRIRLFQALLLFGVLQLLSNLGFLCVAELGRDALGSFDLPPFDLIIVTLKEKTTIDLLLLSAIGFENLTGGMGTAAFVALLMSLCNQKFTATQYALLSAFASVGRVWVGPLAGVLASTLGWSFFFVLSTLLAAPGLVVLWKLRPLIEGLSKIQLSSLGDD